MDEKIVWAGEGLVKDVMKQKGNSECPLAVLASMQNADDANDNLSDFMFEAYIVARRILRGIQKPASV